MSKKKTIGIDPQLEKAIAKLLAATIDDPMASLTDKMKIIDRSLKLEALKLKVSDDAWGSGFLDDDDESETQRYNRALTLGDGHGTESCCSFQDCVGRNYRQIVDNCCIKHDICFGNMDNEQSRLVTLVRFRCVLRVCVFTSSL